MNADIDTGMTGITGRARDAVDAVAKDSSWRKAGQHAAALPDAAGPLKRVLAERRVGESIARYDAHSAAAEGARDKHKALAGRAALSGFLVAATAGVILYVGEKPNASWWALGLTTLQVVFVVAALGSAGLMMWLKPYRDWNKERSLAEQQRLAHFKMLLSTRETANAGELPYEALVLEYVRAFLLDDQRRWFAKRAQDFAPTLKRIRALRLLALGLITIAAAPAVLAVLASGPIDEIAPSIAAWSDRVAERLSVELAALAGVLGGALQTLVTSLAATSLATRNVTAYANMVIRLDEIAAGALAEARAEAATGGSAATGRFWADLAFELAAENREWSAAQRIAQLTMLDTSPSGEPPTR